MKKRTYVVLMAVLLLCTLVLTSCDDLLGLLLGDKATQLEAPMNLKVVDNQLTWSIVDNAEKYVVNYNDIEKECYDNSFSLENLAPGNYIFKVKAIGDGTFYISSDYSAEIAHTVVKDGEDDSNSQYKQPFKKFDSLTTKSSYLGYGIDIINASAVNSKNVLLTYPIFDMNLLMEETLLYSNEHYNEFYTISGHSIESFVDSMSNSSSVSAGQTVSAAGNIKGVDAEASTSLSGGLSTAFAKTSESVASQYFLEIIAENQSYWLILQTSTSRYKEMLNEDFKKDLYNLDPESLFQKYGTHLITSVAMGGSICMYYTMYSYDSSVSEEIYAEIATELSTNVKAAYGSYSGSVDQNTSFEDVYTHIKTAKEHNVHITQDIKVAGGEAFGINNEVTLYQNYFDWQKSLDKNPVIIGVKDNNSLYPIWELLDLNVEGATERYQELYNYFAKYGSESYDKLCETYQLTPTVSPTGITNIDVGEYDNYNENQTVNVTAGQTLQISFDVLPENANKYTKTFKSNDESLATVDSYTGIVTINPNAPAGSYITVTIGAGAVNKQITLFVVNSYTVSFNTRVQGLTVDPIYGVAEGESIYEYEPEVEREGFILEGWYKDSANKEKFNFETEYITSNITLYANWIAIKPLVTFDAMNDEEKTSVNVKYKGTVSKPKDPSRTGYTFAGWYEDEEYTVEYDFATMLTEDITLYAKWNEILYTVTFETNGGTPVAPYDTGISKDYKIKLPTTVKTNYTLEGWYTDPELTDKFIPGNLVTQNITLYAKWEVTVITVSFFDFDGKSEVYDESNNVIASQTTTKTNGFKVAPVIPHKENHIFDGWYYNGEKIDLENYEFVSNEGNIYILIALWISDSYTIKYTVENERDFDKEVTVIRGNAPDKYIPEKEGYAFSGWTYYKDGEIYDLLSSNPETGAVIEARGSMSKCSYTITFNTDGGSYIAPMVVPYGDPITLPSNPTKDGYKFSKWDRDIPATMPAEDITIKAEWNLNVCDVSYNSNDTIHGDVENVGTRDVVSYAVTYFGSARATTYGEYYSFDGWFTEEVGGIQITDRKGVLLKNVSEYTNSDGKWISEKTEVTLYAHWSQTKHGIYIVDEQGFKDIANNLSGTYYIICEEINLSETGIIGAFSGTLDGLGNTIKGWRYTQSTAGNIGLFSQNFGTIRNIVIDDFKITNNNADFRNVYDPSLSSGLLCGVNYGLIQDITLKNSSNEVDVGCSSTEQKVWVLAGGICGYNVGGTISGCRISNVCVRGYAVTQYQLAHAMVGGVVGRSEKGTLREIRCTDVTVDAYSSTEGKGWPWCTNHGKAWSEVGGVAGRISDSTIKDNVHVENIDYSNSASRQDCGCSGISGVWSNNLYGYVVPGE